MKFHRQAQLLTAAIALLVLVTAVVMMIIAGPLLLVAALATVVVVAGLVTRHPPQSRRRPRGEGPHVSVRSDALDLHGSAAAAGASGPRWNMQWESNPPASAVPFAREQLTRALADWGLTGEAGEPAQLVVTEMLSNAIDHARAPIRIAVRFTGESVRVEVHDASAEPPRQQPHDPSRLRGRGLQMVDALSSKWGWTNDAGGKTVWADVSIGWPSD